MKKIFSDPDLLRLQLYRSMLENQGIKAFIKSENAAALKYVLPYNEIIPELWVDEEDYEKALLYLNAEPLSEQAPMPEIFIGTKNKNKISELLAILKNAGAKIILPDDIGGLPDVEEDGRTFEENASKKALFFANFARDAFPDKDLAAIADDSGLEVDALFGAPGVYSSRYAEDDMRRIAKLITEISRANKRSGEDKRSARFVCVIALATREGVIGTFRGEVNGQIIDTPRGTNGFGYDPVFVPDGYTMTFAELSSNEKNRISHRAKALSLLSEYLRENYE